MQTIPNWEIRVISSERFLVARQKVGRTSRCMILGHSCAQDLAESLANGAHRISMWSAVKTSPDFFLPSKYKWWVITCAASEKSAPELPSDLP